MSNSSCRGKMNENWQNIFMKIDLVFKALVELKFEIRWYFLLINPAAYHQFEPDVGALYLVKT